MTSPVVLDTNSAEETYARLRELILDVALVPNSHHLERVIAQRFGMHPSAVHEATRRLHYEGLVCVEPRGGFWISPIDPHTVTETFDRLSRLEARAAYVAALNGADDIAMATLDDSIVRMEDALFRQDRARWASANHHFHRSLVQCSQQADLISTALILSRSVHRARMARLEFGPLPVSETYEHSLLVHAIRRRAADEARDLHLSHWRSSAELLGELLETHRLDSRAA